MLVGTLQVSRGERGRPATLYMNFSGWWCLSTQNLLGHLLLGLWDLSSLTRDQTQALINRKLKSYPGLLLLSCKYHVEWFTIARRWKQLKCTSVEEWMEMWYIYAKEYYSIIKRNEIGSFVEMWMDSESFTQSEVSQEKNKYCILTHICGIWKKNWYRQSCLQSRWRHGRREQRYGGEREVGWIGRLGLTYIHYWYYVWNR